MEDLKIVSRVFCDISHCIVGCLVFYRSSWRFDIWCYIDHNLYKTYLILTKKLTESKIDLYGQFISEIKKDSFPKAHKTNEMVQLTSELWSIEFSHALLDATQNELLL